MKDKIRSLLGLGLDNGVVASAVGVSDSYVTQLMSDDDFRNEVQELRLKNLTELTERDHKWDSLEDAFLKKLDDMVGTGLFFTRPLEVLRALQVLNAGKRRATPTERNGTAQANVVPLILPVVMAPHLTINENGQVVSVDGRTIATMPARVVNEKLGELRGKVIDMENKQLEDDKIAAGKRIASLQKLKSLPVHEVV
jgi:hypothetical protein